MSQQFTFSCAAMVSHVSYFGCFFRLNFVAVLTGAFVSITISFILLLFIAQSANLPQPQYIEKETLAEVDSPTIKAPQQSERFELSDLHCSDGPVQSAIGEEEEKESLLCRYSQTALYFACNCSLLFVPTVWCRRL